MITTVPVSNEQKSAIAKGLKIRYWQDQFWFLFFFVFFGLYLASYVCGFRDSEIFQPLFLVIAVLVFVFTPMRCLQLRQKFKEDQNAKELLMYECVYTRVDKYQFIVLDDGESKYFDKKILNVSFWTRRKLFWLLNYGDDVKFFVLPNMHLVLSLDRVPPLHIGSGD